MGRGAGVTQVAEVYATSRHQGRSLSLGDPVADHADRERKVADLAVGGGVLGGREQAGRHRAGRGECARLVVELAGRYVVILGPGEEEDVLGDESRDVARVVRASGVQGRGRAPAAEDVHRLGEPPLGDRTVARGRTREAVDEAVGAHSEQGPQGDGDPETTA